LQRPASFSLASNAVLVSKVGVGSEPTFFISNLNLVHIPSINTGLCELLKYPTPSKFTLLVTIKSYPGIAGLKVTVTSIGSVNPLL